MIENKIMEIDELYVQKAIDEMQCFGWVVKSTQKIDYTTTYTTGGGNRETGYEFTVHNKRLAYYSINFQRDTKMDNFKELDELYQKYLELLSKYGELASSRVKKNGVFRFFTIFFIIVSLGLMATGIFFLAKDYEFRRTGVCFFAPGAALLLFVGLFIFLDVREGKKCRKLREELEEKKKQVRHELEKVVAEAKEIAYK